jgi:mRNA interferase MazF
MKRTIGGMMYEQGEVVLIPFPYSDLSAMKQRPALVVSNSKLNKTEDRICCLVTSNEPADGLLIKKEDFESGNLPFKSWVKPQRVFTVHEKIIRKKLCKMKRGLQGRVLKGITGFLE